MNEWKSARGAMVVDRDGREVGVVDEVDDRDGVVLVVRSGAQEQPVRVPLDVVDTAVSTAERIVLTGAIAERMSADVVEAGGTLTIPVVAEEAVANVREVEQGRAIIEKRVETVPHVAKIEVGSDEVDVERVRLDQEVDVAPTIRQEGDTLIVPVIEEVLVVTKRYLVREEIRVTKRRVVRQETLREELRREVVTVREERTPPTEQA
jgi:uncharacterized protein (TIGR02271 family)